MKKILFATEFSDHAPEVFKYATELAYFFKTELVVMHVLNQPELPLLSKTGKDNIADESVDKLLKFVEKNLPEDYKDITISYIAKTGLVSKAITDIALEEEIGLIVMGMTGKTNALNTFFGSTAIEVLLKADCPVLLVPPKAVFIGIDNIVYTMDFEFRDLGALNYLKHWTKVLKAPVHCLHVIEKGEDEEKLLKNLSIMKMTFSRHKHITFGMMKGEMEDVIEKFAENKKADIVVMMMNKGNFISNLISNSKVKNVARHIPIPLLVIKDNAFELEKGIAEWIEVLNSIA